MQHGSGGKQVSHVCCYFLTFGPFRCLYPLGFTQNKKNSRIPHLFSFSSWFLKQTSIMTHKHRAGFFPREATSTCVCILMEFLQASQRASFIYLRLSLSHIIFIQELAYFCNFSPNTPLLCVKPLFYNISHIN